MSYASTFKNTIFFPFKNILFRDDYPSSYYFPPKASYFLVVSPEDRRGNLVGLDGAQEKSMKQEGRGRAQPLKE